MRVREEWGKEGRKKGRAGPWRAPVPGNSGLEEDDRKAESVMVEGLSIVCTRG